jgi:hypothetical protein
MQTFRFWINQFVRVGTSNRFQGTMFEAEGVTIEEAHEKIKSQIPEGHKVFACGEWPPKKAE